MSAAKEYLEGIRACDKRIGCLLEDRKYLKDLSLRITASMGAGGGSAGGGNQDKLGSIVTRIIAKEEEIDRAVDELIDKKEEAAALLALLDKPGHGDVLRKRYIQYKSFETIATEIGITYRGVCYLHGRALQAFDKVLEAHRRSDDAAHHET